MLNEKTHFKGELSWTLFDEDGNIKEQGQGHNLIVNAGKALMASLLSGASSTIPTYMAVGSSATAPAVTDTALGTELARVAFSSNTPSGAIVTYVANFGVGVGTGTIQEAGLFSASTGGTMLSRSTSISVTKAAGDTLQITWTITFS